MYEISSFSYTYTCTDGEIQAKLQQGNKQENTKIGFPSKNTDAVTA